MAKPDKDKTPTLYDFVMNVGGVKTEGTLELTPRRETVPPMDTDPGPSFERGPDKEPKPQKDRDQPRMP